MLPGRHDLVVRFEYDGGPPGSGARVTLEVDGSPVGSGRIPVTTAYYFSFDETFNVGVDRGTPVIDDYLPVRNSFEGLIHRVRFDLGPVGEPAAAEDVTRAHLTHQ
jgi:arylsulfatase